MKNRNSFLNTLSNVVMEVITSPLSDSVLLKTDKGIVKLQPGVGISSVDLSSAKLCGANLEGVVFQNANLSNADLSGAVLTGADLEYADLTGAIFHGADLTGVNLQGAKNADLTGAIGVHTFVNEKFSTGE
jgi:uncharacterized protein YjbI with pentapeptide repeats